MPRHESSKIKDGTIDFTSEMEQIAELASPPVLIFPDWDAAGDKPRPFKLDCDTRTDNREDERLSRVFSDRGKKKYMTPVEVNE